MQSSSHADRWPRALLKAGEGWLGELDPAVRASDPFGLVEPRSRLLCAGLGLLSQITYQALGGSRHAAEVGRAGAMLSLLTKIDDQVIDSPAFHGGMAGNRAELREKTRAYLAPTLASLTSGHPATSEARCVFAADLGRALEALAGERARLEHLHSIIAAGWEIQVEAVSVLTSHPSQVSRAEVDSITARISGAWLLMIAMIGALPGDARRPLSVDEEQAFFAWGSAVQRADALADLEKDLADGHLSSYPGRLLWERAPEEYLSAVARGDLRTVYALVSEHEIDRACLLDEEDIVLLSADLARLGEVPLLFAWIQGYLADRYLAHPLSAELGAIPFTPRQPEARLWPTPAGSARCSAP